MGDIDGCRIDTPIEAVVAKGSNYRAAYRRGARVALRLDEETGRVVVTRGGGAVEVGQVTGESARTIASCLRQGYKYTGHILDVAVGAGGKVVHVQLDRPTR